jgi:hypothetical protein
MSQDVLNLPGKSIASLLGAQTVVPGPACRLSESPIWDRQRRFYAGDAADIWGAAVVPHYITANPRIAATHARLSVEFLRAASTRPDDDKPHIIEFGGGTGRFAYLFVRHLRELAPGLDFVYVLTDFSSDRVLRWVDHPSLQPFVADGVLDFAVLDADALAPVNLVVSGRRLEPGALRAPAIGIANYVFDTLRTDAYVVRRGEVAECHFAVPDDDATGAAWVESTEWHAVLSDHVPDELAPILDTYATTLDDTVVLVPTASLRCLEFLDSLTTAPTCALVADKGHCTPTDLCSQLAPAFVTHGDGFSVMVNFDLLARWNRARGGVSVLPRDPAHSLVVAALVLGDVGDAARLEAAIHDELVDVGPDNYFALRSMLSPQGTSSRTLDALLAALRLSRFDPTLLAELLPSLLEVLPAIPEERKLEVQRVLVRVWENYFPIGEPIDMALCVGLTFSAMSRFPEAIDFLERSVKENDESAEAAFAMASARYGYRDLRAALEWTDRALLLEPGFPEARVLRNVLIDELRDEVAL